MNKTQYADNKEMDEIPKIDGISKGSALGILTLTHGGSGRNLNYNFSWKTKQLIGKNLEICFSEGAIQCIIDYVKDDFFHPTSPTNILNLEMYTEYKRHNIIFRAHHCYHTCNKPWYDWAVFRYEKTEREKLRGITYASSNYDQNIHYGDDPSQALRYHYAPAKILGFVKINDSIHAITLCCAYKHTQVTPFVTQWSIEFLNKSQKNRITHCFLLMQS